MAEPYFTRIKYANGDASKDFAAEKAGEQDFQGRDQFVSKGITLSAGDLILFYNQRADTEWAIKAIDEYGAWQRFTVMGDKGIKCNTAGTYNVYLKLKMNDDIVYLEDANATIGGGDQKPGDATCQDGPYGVQVISGKDTVVYEAANTGEVDFQERTQYLAHVQLKQGDVCKLINTSCDATWMVDMDPYDEYINFTGGAAAGQITCNKAGCYDFYIKLKMNDDLLYIGAGTDCGNQPNPGGQDNKTKKAYTSAVPSQCGDVLLQAFYYDSYSGKTYNGVKFSDTKWATLNEQASEIGTYFDMVWLPPSAKSSGGTGYHPSQYSNQNSAWGSRTDLEKFITTMHNSPRKTKVIADIVVNHMDNKSSWCDFWEQDFGSYGKFQPQAAWITSNDELASATTAASCKGKQGSIADDGYGDEANYAAARDLAHSNVEVQNMVKAYLKWMYNTVGYDGWRYDYCKGFNTWHVSNYNKASGAYFSVMEYWDGNIQVLQDRLKEAEWNTLTFDFATKYEAFNRGIAAGNYSGCKGSGLLGAGMSKYAVTFIDSHDSFQRDNNEMCGKNNSLSSANKAKVLQANAFLLSMPGIPCVFYPHWVVFKEEIAKMIMARHATGVHSESSVSDSGDNSGYEAYITGKTGMICLQLGNKVGNAPSGYKTASKGTGYAVYYKTSGTGAAPSVIVTPGSSVFKDNEKGLTVTVKAVALDGTATVYYTTDGTEPTTASQKLTGTTLTFKETTTLKVMAVAGSAKSEVQTFTYTYKAPQDVTTQPITVRFYAPSSWKAVYLYTWNGADLGKWPGKQLTADQDGWYSYTFEKGMKSVNFIFNGGEGAEQTSDLKTDEDVCYSWSGGAEKLLPDCEKPTALPVNKAVELTVYPNPVQDILYINSETAVTKAAVYSLTGQCQYTGSGDLKQIDVHQLQGGMYVLQLQTAEGQTTRLFIKQ